MERQSSFRLGALEKLKSFRGMESFSRKSKDSPGKRGDTALHLAARAGSVPHVQKILAEFDGELAGELAARPNQDGETVLYVAAEKGHTEVVREILKVSDMQTAGIKASNSFDAFHIAAKQGHLGYTYDYSLGPLMVFSPTSGATPCYGVWMYPVGVSHEGLLQPVGMAF